MWTGLKRLQPWNVLDFVPSSTWLYIAIKLYLNYDIMGGIWILDLLDATKKQDEYSLYILHTQPNNLKSALPESL